MEKRMRPYKLVKEIVFSLVLCSLTLLAISGLDYLPYSAARDRISDSLRFPGGLIAYPFYPQGLHTGRKGWAFLAFAGNVAFYTIAWFFLIRVVVSIGRRNRPRNAGPGNAT